MISALIIATFVVFIIIVGFFTLMFLIPFINNLLDRTKRGELFISIFGMFVTVFVLLIVIFGSFGILVRLI